MTSDLTTLSIVDGSNLAGGQPNLTNKHNLIQTENNLSNRICRKTGARLKYDIYLVNVDPSVSIYLVEVFFGSKGVAFYFLKAFYLLKD